MGFLIDVQQKHSGRQRYLQLGMSNTSAMSGVRVWMGMLILAYLFFLLGNDTLKIGNSQINILGLGPLG